jgi:valine dehydrogenase (NAD+)
MSNAVAYTPASTLGVFGRPDFADGTPHQQVCFCEDPDTGLKAIIAIHSTALGPALGGTRFYNYHDESSALTDVLRLSRGMTYKAAVADVQLGGGKAVIIGDQRIKTPELLRAYGRFVEGLGGRYITAGDVGTTAQDMDLVGETTSHVVARTQTRGGSGDSAPLTALGVFRAMQAAATVRWGSPDLSGRAVGIEGIGKVGRHLARLVSDAGALVLINDVNAEAIAQALNELPSTTRAVTDLLAADLDVYAPCAMGGSVTHSVVSDLQAEIVCGAANNQLADPAVETHLEARAITWVPDYVANSGGLIQVAGELKHSSEQDTLDTVNAITGTVTAILLRQQQTGLLAGEVAKQTALDRIAAATRRV